MAFTLPKLPYKTDALQPHFDKRTMSIHHSKHHAGYTNKLNAAIEGTSIADKSIEYILANISQHSTAVRNNAGGFYNHSLFWKILSPKGGGKPSARSKFGKEFYKKFKTFENFKSEFSAAAATQFGSGWAWLCVRGKKLIVLATPNQDNPFMDSAEKKGRPILGLDVWEHAYYLKYQNKRPDYIEAFFKLIDWSQVAKNYDEATKTYNAPKKKAVVVAPPVVKVHVVKKKKAVAKKAPAKKKVTKKVVAKKAVVKKVAAKKTPAKKKVTKQPVVKVHVTKKKKVIAKKPTVKKATVKKVVKSTAKKRVKRDDLKKVEGIGPKIEQLLNKAGIKTYDGLAKAKAKAIKTILTGAGSRYQMHDPKTWPAQAKMASKGDWTKLATWQDELKGGK